MSIEKTLKKLCDKHDVKYIDKQHGHFQLITEHITVNYYPSSKKQTAYISGTRKSYTHVKPKDAVLMALKQPEFTGTKKRNNSKKKRLKLLKKHPFCNWCGERLTEETATLEHRIPLARNGLDNMNNMVLACKPCNEERGHDMTEIKG